MDYDKLLQDYMNQNNDFGDRKVTRWEEKCNTVTIYYRRRDNNFESEYEISLFDLLVFVYSKVN